MAWRDLVVLVAIIGIIGATGTIIAASIVAPSIFTPRSTPKATPSPTPTIIHTARPTPRSTPTLSCVHTSTCSFTTICGSTGTGNRNFTLINYPH